MEIVFQTIITIFIIFPIVTLIHELGHAFFAKLFGAKEIKIELGTGKPLIQTKSFQINQIFYWSGFCYFNLDELTKHKKIKRIFILLGGAIFNLTTLGIMWILYSFELIPDHFIIKTFMIVTLFIAIFSLLPSYS